MIKRPSDIGAFEFSVLSALRAEQLARGCVPRVERSAKLAVTAQREVADRKIVRSSGSGDLVTLVSNVAAVAGEVPG